MTKKISQKILKYTAIFEPEKDGGYLVSVPAVPGCVTQGDTFEEAEFMIKDALEGCLAVLKEEGQEIPTETRDVVLRRVSVSEPVIAYI
jgi:predicted RNase H-like HicB family nuclease